MKGTQVGVASSDTGKAKAWEMQKLVSQSLQREAGWESGMGKQVLNPCCFY